MKFLSLPNECDDFSILEELSERKALSSYPMLRDEKENLICQYLIYYLSKGNALELNEPLVLKKELKEALKRHYSTQPNGLEFIANIRKNSSPDICPMCGSLGTAEVDHVIPKDIYPEFSFFSKNLVPACDCNGKKGTALKDQNTKGRILHPYFDDILLNRLAFIRFSGDLKNPLLSIEVIPAHLHNPAVIYHITNVLKKTNILSWAAKTWSNILRSPESYFNSLFFIKGAVCEGAIVEVITQKMISEEILYRTPNSWNNMLLYGMNLNQDAAGFIKNQINGIRDGSIVPS